MLANESCSCSNSRIDALTNKRQRQAAGQQGFLPDLFKCWPLLEGAFHSAVGPTHPPPQLILPEKPLITSYWMFDPMKLTQKISCHILPL